MIQWTRKHEDIEVGTFPDTVFGSVDHPQNMEICMESGVRLEYAEKCVSALNHLSDSTILEICQNIIKCIRKNRSISLPKYLSYKKHPLTILEHCGFECMYVNAPADEQQILYIVEGEGDWEDVIGFVAGEDRIFYVGTDYFNDRNWA